MVSAVTGTPSAGDARAIMDLNSDALSDSRFGTYLNITKDSVTNTSDKWAHLYYACWMIARSANWSHVTRVGNESFSTPDPLIYEQMYVRRCQDLNVRPQGLGHIKLRKIHSKLDDPTDLNPTTES